jgi:hypothetical protein
VKELDGQVDAFRPEHLVARRGGASDAGAAPPLVLDGRLPSAQI